MGKRKFKVGMVGMGKLGLPCALVMEQKGHKVVGYDPSPMVHEIVSSKRIPYQEAGAQEALDKSEIKLVELEKLVKFSDIIFISVQTPHDKKYEGITRTPDERVDFDYSYLKKACFDVNAILEKLQVDKTVVVISTVMPGTMDREIRPFLGKHFKLCYNPFFIAMTTCMWDFQNPEFVLFGVDDENAAAQAEMFYKTIHKAPFYKTSIKNAEFIKIAYNFFISMKISYANFLMEVSHKTGADVDAVTNALKMATTRVIGPKYLSGGMGDSGGCYLPTGIVYTEKGPTEFQNLKVGERILSSNGLLHEVLETYKRPYKGPMARIKAKGLPEFTVTLNHPFLAAKDLRAKYVSNGKLKNDSKKLLISNPSEVKAFDLSNDYYLICPKPMEASVATPEHVSDSYTKLAGYYLSEGCVSGKDDRISFHMHTKKQNYLREIETFLTELTPNVKTRRAKKNGSLGESIVVHKNKIGKLLKKDFSKLSSNKSFPSWVLYGDIQHAKNILRGLWRGDGSSTKEGFSYSTTSLNLAHGMQHILRRLNIQSTFHYNPPRIGKKDGVKHKESWEIRVRNSVCVEKLATLVDMPIKHKMQAKKYANSIPVIENNSYHKIEKIEYFDYEGTVWNINVEGTHQYANPVINFNCHPRDAIAMSWISEKLGISYDWANAVMEARENQTEFLANLIISEINSVNNGDVVILGTAYKEHCNLEIGSSAILLKNILNEKGIVAATYDPWVAGLEDKTKNPFEGKSPKIFFLGAKHKEFLDFKFPEGSVVIDPFRVVLDQPGVKVIRIGEAPKSQ